MIDLNSIKPGDVLIDKYADRRVCIHSEPCGCEVFSYIETIDEKELLHRKYHLGFYPWFTTKNKITYDTREQYTLIEKEKYTVEERVSYKFE